MKKVFNRVILGILNLYDDFLSSCIKTQLKYCGREVQIKRGAMFLGPENISIGDHSCIGEYTQFKGGGKKGEIIIGKWCQIASFVIIATGNHNINGKLYYDNVQYKSIHIGDNVWIASNAIILPGVNIGNNSVVGAGAVVRKNVPANTIVGGVPAKKIGLVPKHNSRAINKINS